MKVSQLLAGKLIKRLFLAMVLSTLIVALFIVIEKSAEANSGIPFNENDHAGKYVAMGGRTWIVMDVIGGKPYLIMDSIYANRQWNESNDSSNPSKIFQYLQDELDNIITVAEDRDLIAETTWEIRSMMMFDQFNEYTTTGGKPINPTSITQKLGLISNMEVLEHYCNIIEPVLSNVIWTRTPDYDSSNEVFVTSTQLGGCGVATENSNKSNIGVQPVLYLKDSVRIRGGLGTKDDPYVLSISDAPNAADIEANGTTDTVTVKNVPANTTVKVYASNGSTVIGSNVNGSSVGEVKITTSIDLRWNDTVYVTFTQPSKGESNKVEATVFDNAPPEITLNAIPTEPTNQKVTVTAIIIDQASDVVAKKWAQGNRNAEYFSTSGQNLTGDQFEVTENGTFTVFAKDAAGNSSVKQITINNIDRNPPTLSNVSIRSSNSNTEWAKVGDQITLTFEASKMLGTESKATIVGNDVAIQNTSDLKYKATYTMQNTDPEGLVTFSISYQDIVGNKGTPVTSTNDNSQVLFDKTAPVIQFSQNGNTYPAKTAQSKVTVTDDGSGIDEGTLEYVWTNSEVEPTSGWQPFNNGIELKLEDENMNGNWYLHIRAKDKADNASYEVSKAFLLDNTPPVITVIGENPLTLEAGETFNDLGAIASDNIDGDITNLIEVTGNVDTTNVGTYTLNYSVTDQAGNKATVSRTVHVKDRQSPIISFAPNGKTSPAKTAQSKVTVTDDGSGIDEGTLEYVWTNSEVEPTDGWQPFNNGIELKLEDENMNGNWYLHIRVKDKAGNESYEVSQAFVLDNTPPVIHLIGDDSLIVEAGEIFNDPGATAIDDYDGDLSNEIVVTGTVDTMTLDEYVLSYDVKDTAGNTAKTVTRKVVVKDTQPPIIELKGEAEITLMYGATFDDPGATAMDSFEGDVSHLIEVKGTIDPMKAGTYTLQYVVQDSSGNSAQAIRKVHVSPKPNSSPSSSPSARNEDSSQIFIDMNGSLKDGTEFDLSQSTVILNVAPKDGARSAFVTIPVSTLQYIVDKNPNLNFAIETPYGNYFLPARLQTLIPKWDELLQENKWQAEQISFKLTFVDMTEDEEIQTALREQFHNSQPISTIVDVHLVLVDSKTDEVLTEIEQFTEPLSRLIPLNEGINPTSQRWGAFRYDLTNNEFQFVPARFEQKEGKSYALIRSYSNSVYLVAENDVRFVDMNKHWGKDDVEIAAAKGLVRGVGHGKYAPNHSVTRAEFATMLVRALGRNNDLQSDLAYRDVKREAWYMKEVAQATELGLLDFIQDGYLRPNQPLTREEMASMLAATIRLEKESLPLKRTSLDRYKDKGKIAESYREDIELIATLGIMLGTRSDQFSPKGETTRAQAATVLLRTLKELEWIN